LARRGKEWTTSSKRASARTWQAIWTCLDSDADKVVDDWFVWMPAHRTSRDIGVACKSDGSFLTAVELLGNAAADVLAKSACARALATCA
jgi:hypothetical protein